MDKESFKKIPKDKREKVIVEIILNIISENYFDYELCIDTIAFKLNYHPAYISALFKRCFGKGVSRQIEIVRMEKALEFLKHRESVADVAVKVGYNDPKSFSRAFKRNFGVIPSKFYEQ